MTHCVGGRLWKGESTEDRRTRNAGPQLGLSVNSVGKEAEKYELRTSPWKSAGEGAQQTVENNVQNLTARQGREQNLGKFQTSN